MQSFPPYVPLPIRPPVFPQPPNFPRAYLPPQSPRYSFTWAVGPNGVPIRIPTPPPPPIGVLSAAPIVNPQPCQVSGQPAGLGGLFNLFAPAAATPQTGAFGAIGGGSNLLQQGVSRLVASQLARKYPQFAGLLQNPQVMNLLQNPEVQKLLQNPQVLQAVSGIVNQTNPSQIQSIASTLGIK